MDWLPKLARRFAIIRVSAHVDVRERGGTEDGCYTVEAFAVHDLCHTCLLSVSYSEEASALLTQLSKGERRRTPRTVSPYQGSGKSSTLDQNLITSLLVQL